MTTEARRPTTVQIKVTVNGEERTGEVEPQTPAGPFHSRDPCTYRDSHRLRYDSLRSMHRHSGWKGPSSRALSSPYRPMAER